MQLWLYLSSNCLALDEEDVTNANLTYTYLRAAWVEGISEGYPELQACYWFRDRLESVFL